MSAAAALPADEPSDTELRHALRRAPLIVYEKLLGAPTAQAVGNAERILSEGWRLGQAEPLSLTGLLPWDDFQPAARSWNFHLNCWDPLDELLAAHSATGERRYLEPALRVALDWIEQHADASRVGGVHAWYDMAVGVRAYRLAYLLDAAAREPWVPDDEVVAMRASIEAHRRELSDDAKIAFHNNHGFYQVAGQLAMARRFGAFGKAMAESHQQAAQRLRSMIDQQFTEEGVHREHSPDYHRMVYGTLKGIVDAGLLSDSAIQARVDAIERSLAWFVLPNGYLANFGDSDYRQCSRGNRAAVDKWRTAEMRHAVTGGQVGTPAPEPLRVFAKSGYFVVKKRAPEPAPLEHASYLAQTAAFHSRTHKHADDLSLIWYDRGSPILVDAGRYGYDGKTEVGSALWNDGFWYSDPNRVYCESTRAHNTVEIDERNYARKGAKPYGSALKRWGAVGDEVFWSECEVKQFRSIRHVRLLIFRPGAWLVVWDWLHDNLDAEHDFRQWFHFSPELSLLQADGQYCASMSRWSESLRVASLLPGVTLCKPVLGRHSPVQQGFWSPKAHVVVPAYAVALEQRARSATFATVLAFCSALRVSESSRVAGSGRSAHLRFQTDKLQHVLTLSRPEEGTVELAYRAEN